MGEDGSRAVADRPLRSPKPPGVAKARRVMRGAAFAVEPAPNKAICRDPARHPEFLALGLWSFSGLLVLVLFYASIRCVVIMRTLFTVGPGMLALLKLLQDGRFHSGEALGAALGVSRSAIWKQLQNLESELGIEIFKVPGRGYRLATPLALLDVDEIVERTGESRFAITVLEDVDSTNTEVARRLARGCDAPFAVIAERQSAGRGRRGRAWVSPVAENLYCSVALKVDGGMRQVEALSLTVGLAVARVLRDFGLTQVGLKWPNDLLVDQRKVAGVLLELTGDPADICHVVIGIGINVNMAGAVDIDQPWTSIRQVTGAPVNRNELAAELLKQLDSHLARHWRDGFSSMRAEWESLHLWHGRGVVLQAGDRATEGVVLGVEENGAIRLSVDGVERSFSGGELSLRLRDDS